MIIISIETIPECPWPVIMAKHEILKAYSTLPENTRLAADHDFFKPGEVLWLGKPYFWQRLMDKTFNASRVKKDSYDTDLRQTIQGKRVWVLDK